MADVQIKAFSAYPRKYRPKVDRTRVAEGFRSCDWQKGHVFYGAFDNEGILSAYCIIEIHESYFDLSVEKSDPAKEKLQVNAALISQTLKDLPLSKERYITNGSRSVVHETAFDDYLEKYFGFRKAYCDLHIAYRPGFGLLVKALYPLRKILKKLDGIGLVHKINGVLMMESIANHLRKK